MDDKGLFGIFILFKVIPVMTFLYPYQGGDHAAAKVANHELRGLMSFLECQKNKKARQVDIHGSPIPPSSTSPTHDTFIVHTVPLMALIDFRGFRLVAMSLLPINVRRRETFSLC